MRIIPSYPNYSITPEGRVYSSNRMKYLRQYKDKDGYSIVQLYRNGLKHTLRVHRLVLETYVGLRPKGKVACHINGNKCCNHVYNLRWGTYKSNEADKEKHGTRLLGSKLPWSKLTERDVLKIKKMLLKYKIKDIAELFNVSPTTICDIKHQRSWSWL
jgi:hypothetical protein